MPLITVASLQILHLFCTAPTNGNDWASGNMPAHQAFAQSTVGTPIAKSANNLPTRKKMGLQLLLGL
jgi:hypothetical protein